MTSKIFIGPDNIKPRWTWRTKLVTRFMRGFVPKSKAFRYILWGLEPDGCVKVFITTHTGEIVVGFDMSSHMFSQLLAQMKEVDAHRKLVE